MLGREADHGASSGGHDGAGSMRWLLTYADLITLMMVFFVVMYSMSKRDQTKYAALAASLRRSFAVAGGDAVIATAPPPSAAQGVLSQQRALEEALQKLSAEVQKAGFAESVQLTLSTQGLVVSFTRETAFFSPARAELQPGFEHLLHAFAPVLQAIPNEIQVDGFTDNLPLHSSEFATSWELSSRRATNVVRFLTEQAGLDPRRFVALAFGEYRPKYSNDDEAGRRKNRRVDLIVLRHPPEPPWGVPVRASAPATAGAPSAVGTPPTAAAPTRTP